MVIQLPEKVKKILDMIQEAGFEAYAVGGCVRDSILNREPEDWDITTSAKPEQIKQLFIRTIDTGIEHGTVTVMMGKEGFEVTTYRIDGTYEDARHPKEVCFTPNLEEDLRRRDFTINAMAYNETCGLVDQFGGMEDIKRGLICCVGDPTERFREDALRMMRAVRFCAQLGYGMDAGTRRAIQEMAGNLKKISAERIRTELYKLLISPHPELLKEAFEVGITQIILPEFDRCMETKQRNIHHCYSVGEHILHALCEVKPEPVLRLAVLFHDIGKPVKQSRDEEGVDHFYGHAQAGAEMTGEIMKRLRFDNETLHTVTELVRYHDYEVKSTPAGVRKAMSKMGASLFPLVMDVKKADVLGQSDYQRAWKLSEIEKLREIYAQVMKQGDPVTVKDLDLTGRDLIDRGMKPGPELGALLQNLLEEVLLEPSNNKKEILLERSEELRKNLKICD